MLRTVRALMITTLLASSTGPAWAEEAKFSLVQATGGPEAGAAEAVDHDLGPTNGWRVAPGTTQAAVFRALSPLSKGNLRVWLQLSGQQRADHFGEFALSVTSDPQPSLASEWEPLFPVTLLTDEGELSREGFRVKIAGPATRPLVRVDSILCHDATAIKIDVWPSADAREPSLLTELWANCSPIESTNIALGCSVRASGEVGAGQHPRYLTDGQNGTFVHPAMAHPAEPFFFEIDLGRVATLDHVSLVNRAEGGTMGRLSQLRLQLFEEPPQAGGAPVWSARHRDDGTSPEPGKVDAIPASNGQGVFRGRYLRISSESTVAFSPQIAEVGVYESLTASTVKLTANGQPLPTDGSGLRIPASEKRLMFSLIPPELPGALRLGTRAKVVGVDDYWLPVGSRDELNYYGLPPGEFVFEAQLSHTDNVWNTATFRIPLEVIEPWWQRPAAHAGAAVLAVAISALVAWRIARYRMSKRLVELERRQELSSERRRIARDMHDVVGSRLTQLAVMHELYAEQNDLPAEARSNLKELTRTAREAIASLDETVWAINPRNDTLQGVADYLCHAASCYLQPLGITCRQDVQDSWPAIEVGAQKRHELLNAFKEALQNVVKHSGASAVTLTLRLIDHSLFIALEDNGRGLPVDLGGREKDGLENMSHRLAELHGTCQVGPGKDGGTLVEMRLPL